MQQSYKDKCLVETDLVSLPYFGSLSCGPTEGHGSHGTPALFRGARILDRPYTAGGNGSLLGCIGLRRGVFRCSQSRRMCGLGTPPITTLFSWLLRILKSWSSSI